MTRWQFFLAQLTQTALLWDQAGNVFAGWASFVHSILARRGPPQVHSSDETISAHLWRSHQKGRLWGRVLMPIVDLVFSWWQRDEQGQRVFDHCRQAFEKEKRLAYLPAEYRDPPQSVGIQPTDAMKGPRP